MALGFSQGLLSGLRTAGQGELSRDPADRNLLEKAGVTNPLLQQFGQGFGSILGVDMRSDNQVTQDAYRGIDMTNPRSMLEAAAKLDRVDPKQAAALRAKASTLQDTQLQTQTSEKAAMMEIIDAHKNGIIDKDRRDLLLKGVGTRTIDPARALSTIDQERKTDTAKKDMITKSLLMLDKAKENGAVNDSEYDTLKYQVENEGLYGQQLAGVIRTNIDNNKKKENLVKYATALKLDEKSLRLVSEGVVSTEAGVKALAKDDGLLPLPESISTWLDANKDNPAVQSWAATVPSDGVVTKDWVLKVAALQDRIENRKRIEERAANRTQKQIDKRAGGDLSKQDLSLFETMYETDDEIEKAVDNFLDGGMWGASKKEREALYIKAARAYPALPEDQAILSYIRQGASGSPATAQPVTGDDPLLSEADKLVGG